MSQLIVPIAQITKLSPHPNADKLEIVEVLGWQIVVDKDTFKEKDNVLYVPPDAVLPLELSEEFGVTAYLSKGRVKSVRLRGEPSFGFVVPLTSPSLKGVKVNSEDNYAEELGITKYEPPVKPLAGDQAPDRADFPKYTSIENLRNFPRILNENEEIIVTEKIHGTNCRVGVIDGELVAGSRGTVRKPPQTPDGEALDFATNLYKSNIYWSPFAIDGVRHLLSYLGAIGNVPAVLFGEVFGNKIQSMNYGVESGHQFRTFDLMIGGQYVDYDLFLEMCEKYDIPTAPVLYRGPFNMDEVVKHSKGDSTIGGDHTREGVVVKPVVERTDPKTGRVILKYLSDDYLLSKKSDYTEV